MGIGYLRIVDRDIVSRSDLHRQHLYGADSIGLPKVEMARQKLKRLNPDVTIEAIPESLNSINAQDIISGMDVVERLLPGDRVKEARAMGHPHSQFR